jgi:hypothetical protein
MRVSGQLRVWAVLKKKLFFALDEIRTPDRPTRN